jgi:hypothetical protein
MTPSFEHVWGRILRHQGATFAMARRGTLTYHVDGDLLQTDRKGGRVHISQFRNAMVMMPVSGPKVLNDADIWGPSYVYAIMMDDRIRAGDW